MSYQNELYLIKMGQLPKTTGPKQKNPLKKKSDKKVAEEKDKKELRGGDDTFMEKWHKSRRKDCTGTCQCGCGQPSQKKDDMYFRHSNCHIFPKNIFESVMYHPLNFVERRFWGGCHSIMDDTSMDRWPNMADWDDIKEKFFVLAPLLTDKERGHKFYKHLESLVYSYKYIAGKNDNITATKST